MKLRLIALLAALFLPLAACAGNQETSENNTSAETSGNSESPATDSAAAPANSPTDSSAPESDAAKSADATNGSENGTATEGWYDYSPSDKSYQVKFPSEPQTQDDMQVILDKGAKAYLVRKDEIEIPEGVEVDVNTILEGARGGLAASGEVENEQEVEKNGISGRELLVTGEGGKVLKARVFFDPDNGRLYQAIVGAVDGELPKESDTFLESFEIVK